MFDFWQHLLLIRTPEPKDTKGFCRKEYRPRRQSERELLLTCFLWQPFSIPSALQLAFFWFF